MSSKEVSVILQETIEQHIYLIRGKKVMLDAHLAELYNVSSKRLNEQMKRNKERFPEDFVFQLNREEWDSLRSQIATSNLKGQVASSGRGGRRYYPYVFTEQGVAMLSSVLHSDRAIAVNIQIMRTFSKLRELMVSHRDLAKRIEKLEKQFQTHDDHFVIVFEAIKKLLQEPESKKEKIGF